MKTTLKIMNKTYIKYLLIVLSIFIVSTLFYLWQSVKDRNLTQQTDTHPKLTHNESEITELKTLKAADGTPLGRIVLVGLHSDPPDPSSGRLLNDVFSALYVVKNVDGKDIILYKINNEGFFNVQGKEIDVAQDNFYGFQFAKVYDDHFVIHMLKNNGREMSDDATIYWNSQKGIFEIYRINE